MNTEPVIRLHLFFARDCERAVILRQGPSKVFRMILWDRSNDVFEDGQWLKHKVFVERCDLSPDGEHFIYFALDGRWGTMAKGSYTAISKPPFFTALALFPEGDTWGGGGRFLDARHYVADGGEDIVGRTEDIARVYRGEPSKGCSSGLRLANGKPAPFDKATRDALLGKTVPVRDEPLDRYDTQGGRLYRRSGGEMDLIRDFSGMSFEHIRAPYDWREEREGTATTPWHPLNGEGA